MQLERLAVEASARVQGGFTDSQWDRLCELENIAMAPIIANAMRMVEMNWFRANEVNNLFKEGAD